MSDVKPRTQPATVLGTSGPGGTPPTSGPPGGWVGGPEQMRRLLLFGVIGFIILVFLLLVAFGGGSGDPKVKVLPGLADQRGKGLQIAQEDLKTQGWKNFVVYDATGQDRSLRERREWQVCYQSPAANPKLDDHGTLQLAIDGREKRDAGEVWLGAVRTDEDCTKLGGDYGIVPRVYDVGSEAGTETVPNLYGFTAHMARVAFGDDASIRVTRVPVPGKKPRTTKGVADLIKEKLTGEDKAIQADNADEVGSGWDGWQVCTQSPVPNSPWGGRVIKLDVVRYGDSCTNPKKS